MRQFEQRLLPFCAFLILFLFSQAGLHVWKTIVANTPKTLKEIMPTLMDLIVRSLASESAERRQVRSLLQPTPMSPSLTAPLWVDPRR